MSFFKWLFRDVKSDLETLKEIGKGEYKSKYTLKEFFTFDWEEMSKKYGVWFLLLILAFCVGYFVATQRLQDACNQFIIDNELVKATARSGLEAIKNYITTNITAH